MTFRIRVALCRIIVLICMGLVFAAESQAAEKPSYADNVVIIMVDGLRPDALKQVQAPVLEGLIKRGSFTMKAQTVNPSLTLPAFASMLTGLPVEAHGVNWNDYEPQRGYLKAPTIFEIATFNGSKWGAAFIQKEKLLHATKQDRRLALHVCNVSEQGCTAKKIAADVINSYKTATDSTKPSLFLIHFAEADVAGHADGWMSKPYLKTVEDIDRAIGTLIKGFKELGLYERTTFIVSADHGGHGTTHGTTMPEDMTIPWIAAGPGVKAGHEIRQPVSLMDTPATVMRAFGISDYYVEWKSRSVEEMFEVGTAAAPAGAGRPSQ
ncbi:MAG: alkaline phosphatase family protein [Nitrospirae bacterium]|nr:alkaline phosphatase family protein [Nitrospirota bacterium]